MASKLNIQEIESTTGTLKVAGNVKLDMSGSNDFMDLPAGTSDQRGTPVEGAIRWNYDYDSLEVYDGTTWKQLTKKYDGDDIVKAGLVLHLDASNKNSYAGNGANLYDLSGNNNHASPDGNTPVYTSANGGGFIYNGLSSYHYGSSSPNNLQGLNAVSLFIWLKSYGPSPSRRYAFDGRGNKIIAQKNEGVGMGFDAGYSQNKIFNFVQGNDGTYTEANTPTTYLNNQVYQIGLVREENNSEFKVLDTDSVTLITPGFTGPRMTSTATVALGPYVYGTYASSSDNGNYWWNGEIYCILGYNRALSQEEVTQNFNALRGRFGV
jgi:hypothetical protein